MADAFIPLVPVKNAPRESAAASGAKSGLPTFTASNITAEGHSENCAKPVVKLQRQGDLVSSIRIECGCGQVIELACVY